MPIDLRSDTVTVPTQKMRDAMRDAMVGDDVYGEDPTINRLEQLAAKRVGKEAALFVTSGTQGNQVAVLSHTQRGDEVILEEHSHIFKYETAGLSTIAGVQARTIKGINGQMPVADIVSAIREDDIHCPKTALICLENTHGDTGGSILPLSYMEEVHQISRQHQIPVHMDGARLFNAAVGLGVDPKEITKYTDTVQFCLSKGLSAPMGSIVAGPKDFIDRARKWRKMLGGGTRQAGIVGAAGIIALEEMIGRLQEDHEHAKMLAEGLVLIPGMNVDPDGVETNMIMFSTEGLGVTSEEFIKQLNDYGILANSAGPYRIRFVTHRGITKADVDSAIEAVKNIANEI